MPAKRQHYVPRAYLAAFTDPATPEGQEPYLWVYEREQERPYARAPHKVAVRSHYYSVTSESGEQDDAVEKFLSRVESEAISVIRLLIRGRDPISLTEEQRRWLADFISLLSVRIPGFRDSVEQFAAEVMRHVALLGAQRPEYFARTVREACESNGMPPPDDIESVRQFALSGEYTIEASPFLSLQMLIQLAPVAAQYIHAYRWRILKAPQGKQFITSDRPVVLISTERPPHGWGTGWETPWMEATVPLAPDTCLLISLHHSEGIEQVGSSIIDEINCRTAAHASEAVYSSSRIDATALNLPAEWTWWQPATDAVISVDSAMEMAEPPA